MSKTLNGFFVFGFVVQDKEKFDNLDFDVLQKQCEAYGCCISCFGPSEKPSFVIGIKTTLVNLNSYQVSLIPARPSREWTTRKWYKALRTCAKALGLTLPSVDDFGYFAGIYDG